MMRSIYQKIDQNGMGKQVSSFFLLSGVTNRLKFHAIFFIISLSWIDRPGQGRKHRSANLGGP